MKHDLEIHSEEVQDIFGAVSPWVIRSGIGAILLILISIITVSWFIKYPETVRAELSIISEKPRARLIARTQGTLKFLVKEEDQVKKGEWLSVIDNAADVHDVLRLKRDFAEITEENQVGGPLGQILDKYFKEDLKLGELENSYLRFIQAKRDYELAKASNLKEIQIKEFEKQIIFQKELIENFKKQKKTSEKQLELSRRKYETNKKLLEQGVISKIDFNEIFNQLLHQEKNVYLIEEKMISTQKEVSVFENRLTEIKATALENIEIQKGNLWDAVNLIIADLRSWEQMYVLKAPIDGTVHFVKYWEDNQVASPGEEILTVLPNEEKIIGVAMLPMTGSSEVQVGQQVQVSLLSYSSIEYGYLLGEIFQISTIPQDLMYRVMIEFPDELKTTYGFEIEFQQELFGVAEIITSDLRLIERFYHKLIKAFEAKPDKVITNEEKRPSNIPQSIN
ncbi:MAG: HlyD family efflux transporter periplasmic adaptor subunit [Phaeodactylibacter sp.]|nr:HlyD family efflux transporter periplasmic adaptor subunit [Phaeodactylibacter sp.]